MAPTTRYAVFEGQRILCLTDIYLQIRMKIVYTSHAENKFEILRKHGVVYTRDQIEDVLHHPDKIEKAERGRMTAQKAISETHLIRVIYEKGANKLVVITFYPGRRERYESKL